MKWTEEKIVAAPESLQLRQDGLLNLKAQPRGSPSGASSNKARKQPSTKI